MTASDLLAPYVPRLVVEWLADAPNRTHRQVNGTLAFVDISGFTRLTERLATRGQAGAEEMGDVLNSTFEALLTDAYEYGAGLVKWGGDAALLLFDDEDHAARACAAACDMQRTMRRAGRLRTSAGPVRLQMSIGIHSGAIDFYLVGNDYRELVVTGEAATLTAVMEQVAGPAETVLSTATVAELGAAADRLVEEIGEETGYYRLRRPPEATAEPVRSVKHKADLDIALPAPIREHLMAGPVDGEHRRLSVAFIEFAGTDELTARFGRESVAETLDDLMRRVQAETARHNVTHFTTDINRNGGKLLLVAGAPRATGDDEARLLAATQAILSVDLPLRLRAGINSGRAYVGDFGPDYRRTYSIVGDCVNLAARVMGKADSGQILATLPVLERSRVPYDAVAVPPFTVKGKTKPVEAFVVGAARAQQASEAADRHLPFVGRDHELSTLLERLAAARAGRGQFVELVGSPGLGKSRLVSELIVQAGDIDVFETQGDVYGASTAYRAVRRLLCRALGVDDERATADEVAAALTARVGNDAPELEPWLPLLGIALDVELTPTPEVDALDEKFRRVRLQQVVFELLAATLTRPTIIVFDDAHLLDEESADLLRHVVAGFGGRPWLIVATQHEPGAPWSASDVAPVTRVSLAPLSATAVAEILEAATADAPLPPHELAGLTRRADGNPLFLRELVAVAQQSGTADGLPDSIEGMISAQIDRLHPADRRLLRAASVLGLRFEKRVVEAMLGGDVSHVGRGAWTRLSGFLQPEAPGVLRFQHVLMRDTAYEGLSYRRRQTWHGRVAETLEDAAGTTPDTQADLLSLHYFYAGRYDAAWRFARIAGDRAAARYANSEAVELYTRAADSARLLGSVPAAERAPVWERLGEAHYHLGEFTKAGVAFREARRCCRDDAVALARLRLRSAVICERAGNYGEALSWVTRGYRPLRAVAGPDAAKMAARLSAKYANLRHLQGRERDAIGWAQRALDEAERAEAKDAGALALQVLDWAYVALGRLNEEPYAERALALYEEIGDLSGQARAVNHLGYHAYFEGRWVEAHGLYERARALFEKVGDEWHAAIAAGNAGEILFEQGHLEVADAVIRHALRVWHASGVLPEIAFGTSLLGRVAARAGRLTEALALLNQAKDLFTQVGEPLEVLDTEARIAECLVLGGMASAALTTAEDVLVRCESAEGLIAAVPLLHRVRGYAYAQLGHGAAVRPALDASRQAAERRGARHEVALTIHAMVTLGVPVDGSEAALLVRSRDELFAQLGIVSTPTVPLSVQSAPAAAVPAPRRETRALRRVK